MMRKLAALYFPLYACLLVVGRELVTVLFTELYRESWPIFAVNLTLIPICILTAACDPVLRAYPAYTTLLVRIRVALVALLIVGLWAVTAHHWLLGAILVMVGANAIDRLAVSVMLGRVLHVSRRDLPLFRDVAKLAAAAALGGVAAAVVRAVVAGAGPFAVLIAGTAALAAVYVGSVVALGVATEDEREAVRRWVSAMLLRVGFDRREPALGKVTVRRERTRYEP
jgi:O-antigen/teichoic acid export membrane protein